MKIKAQLKLILKAGDTVVAEVEDPVLWGKVLDAVQGLTSKDSAQASTKVVGPGLHNKTGPIVTGDPKKKLADELGVDEAELDGALTPSTVAPYLTLDKHSWQAMKQGTPERGPGAISPAGLAATLLNLWFEAASIKDPVTQAKANAVLTPLGATDHNPGRSIKNTRWLKSLTGGAVIINPARLKEALTVAKAFCTSNWSDADKGV